MNLFNPATEFLVLTKAAGDDYRRLTGRPGIPEEGIRAHVISALRSARPGPSMTTRRGFELIVRVQFQSVEGDCEAVLVWGIRSDGFRSTSPDGLRPNVYLVSIRSLSEPSGCEGPL